MFQIKSKEGSILYPILYLLYTYDISEPDNTTIAIIAIGNIFEEVVDMTQSAK